MMLSTLKVVLPAALTFFIGFFITPFFANIFYKHRMWKKKPRTESEITTDDFTRVHNTKGELSTPRTGGMIIWVSVLLTLFLIWLLSMVFPNAMTEKFNFLSRNQTLVPLVALVVGALIGLADDLLQIFGKSAYAEDKIVYRRVKVGAIMLLGLSIGSWFYFKLGMHAIHVPFDGSLDLGILFIPIFVIVMLAAFSTSVIDGIDGLSGGVLASIFAAYAVIAFVNNQIDIAAFSAAIAGGTLAFLWFNVPPARFYMGETGMLALTVTLSVIAFLTNSVLLLPVIAFPLVLTSLSDIIQMISYRYFGKRRVFKVAPLHHHFEAIGWSKEKVVMRYWIIALVSVIIGTILVLVS
ncbi:MAG: hypothetical protein KGH93_01880 [Patescibacteria group bacterium]|nr:hypothetical protein [Patescibacteria group bacterium]MDE1945927.1 hypothetical protein [Patescibacteria group bacterium]